jgi:hypothetical protein
MCRCEQRVGDGLMNDGRGRAGARHRPSAECAALRRRSLRRSYGATSVTKTAPPRVQSGRGRSVSSITHSLKASVRTGAVTGRPAALAIRSAMSALVAGVIRSTIVLGKRMRPAVPAQRHWPSRNASSARNRKVPLPLRLSQDRTVSGLPPFVCGGKGPSPEAKRGAHGRPLTSEAISGSAVSSARPASGGSPFR